MTTWGEDPATLASQIWDEELSGRGAWDPSPQPPDHESMNTPEKVGSLLSAAGFTLGRVWLEPLEYQWDVPRFTGLRTRFGATKRKLDTLDPARGLPRSDRSADVVPQLEGSCVPRHGHLRHGRSVTPPAVP